MSEKGAAQRNGPAPHSDILAPFGKKRLFWGGKTQKKSAKKILRLLDTHKMYILQKNWTKTVNPALSSGLNFFPPPIWGHHHQLDDQQRNPNMNNRDHLVGQFTSPDVHPTGFADLTDLTLADEDTNSILADNAKRAIQGNEAMQVM